MTNATFAAPALTAGAFAGVRTRRLLALGLDLIVVSVLAMLLWTALVALTLGLAIFVLPSLWPFVAFFYNGVSVSGRNMATPGMRMMDLEMRMHESGARVPFINAAAHALMFYLSWFLPLVFLVTLVDGQKRLIHDMLAGVLVTRRL